MDQKDSCDILIIGTTTQNNYIGSRTFYLSNILKKYAPDLTVGIYDIYEENESRLDPEKVKNYIFLPWSETIDLGWIDFLSNKKGKNILYTEYYYWYQEIKQKIFELGFNIENIFNTIAFSSRECSSWWDNPQYSYWGPSIYIDFFRSLPLAEKKYLYVDTPWSLDSCSEPYNAISLINEVMPIIKSKHPNIKIITQNYEARWVDENIPLDQSLKSMLNHYSGAFGFIVSHQETLGLPQIEAQLMGTKVITTTLFSNHASRMAGNKNIILYEYNDMNSFIEAIEQSLNPYDPEEIKYLATNVYNDSMFFNNLKKDLWGL